MGELFGTDGVRGEADDGGNGAEARRGGGAVLPH